jgi:hypothetical protein
MIFIPGQTVIVLDTNHKPVGAGVVEIYNADAGSCMVLFKYPYQDEAESISIPVDRLITN